MKNIFLKLSILLIFSSTALYAQHDLTIYINHIKNKNGLLQIGLFNQEKGFLKEGFQYAKKRMKVNGNSITYTFTNLPSGNYAVAIFHDENMNNTCDTNFIGLPVESYGFSNNFQPKIAAPKFNQTKIVLNQNKTIAIKLIH